MNVALLRADCDERGQKFVKVRAQRTECALIVLMHSNELAMSHTRTVWSNEPLNSSVSLIASCHTSHEWPVSARSNSNECSAHTPIVQWLWRARVSVRVPRRTQTTRSPRARANVAIADSEREKLAVLLVAERFDVAHAVQVPHLDGRIFGAAVQQVAPHCNRPNAVVVRRNALQRLQVEHRPELNAAIGTRCAIPSVSCACRQPLRAMYR